VFSAPSDSLNNFGGVTYQPNQCRWANTIRTDETL
jgi:hypothetical protein